MDDEDPGSSRPDDEYMTIQEGADYLKMSKRWLEQRLHDSPELLRPIKFGRSVRLRKSNLDAFAESQQIAVES